MVSPFQRLRTCLLAVLPGWLLPLSSAADQDEAPFSRTLTPAEWAGVQAAHEDPRPAVRAAAEILMQGGTDNAGTWGTKIAGAYRVSDPSTLPAWTKPPPSKAPDSSPADTIAAKWARLKIDVGGDLFSWCRAKYDDSLAFENSLAAAMLENEDPQLVEDGLKALSFRKAKEYVPKIAPLIFHRDEEIAALAIEILGKFGATDQAPALDTLAETRPAMRYAVMYSLRHMRHPRAVAVALRMLDHPGADSPGSFWSLTDEVIHMLNGLSSPEHIPALRTILESDRETDKSRALDLLVKWNAKSEAPVIARLLDPKYERELRGNAAMALGKLQATEYAPDLARLLQDVDMDWYCADALASMHAVEQAPVVRAALDKLTGSQIVRLKFLRTLYQLQSLPREELLRQCELILRQPESWFAWDHGVEIMIETGAVECLETILRQHCHGPEKPYNRVFEYEGQPDPLPALGLDCTCREIAWFLQSPDEDVVQGALNALGAFGARDSIPQIAAFLDPSVSVKPRSEAIDALVKLRASGLNAPLITLTKSSVPDTERLEALQALLRLSPVAGVDRAAEMLLTNAEPDVLRIAILKFLNEQNLKTAAPLIASLLTDKNEEILRAAISSLHWLGNEQQVDAILPLLSHATSSIRGEAARLLCSLGPRGRTALLTATDDTDLRSLALRALMEHDEATLDQLTPDSKLLPGDRIRRAAWWAYRREPGVSSFLADGLLDDNREIRESSLAALIVIGGPAAPNVLPACLESAARFPGEEGPLLLAAWMLCGEDAGMRAALPWLDGGWKDRALPMPADAAAAAKTVRALQELWLKYDPQKFRRLHNGAALSAAKIISAAEWNHSDLPLLESIAADLSAMPAIKIAEAEVQQAILHVKENTPLRRTLRALGWTIVGQLTFWLLALLIYPWSTAAQWMLWHRPVRRWLGLGWVEPLVLRTPWLRDRLWLPFREALVPPGEVLTFDEWTFYDAVRIAPVNGTPCPALPVLRLWRGTGVLRGESGLGKTTLLQALAASAQRPAAFLRAVECRDGLLAALQSRLPRLARKDTAFLRALVVRGSPDIFVDAVQEAPVEVQGRLTKDITSLPGGNFLLSTQPSSWQPPAGASVWDLQPLQESNISFFLLKQGTAAIEAAGSLSLAERQRAFTDRVHQFLGALAALPPEDPRAVARRRMLSNPMEAVLAAELFAAGKTPDPHRLLAQRMEHVEEDFSLEQGAAFPAKPFAEHLLAWRRRGGSDPALQPFPNVASFLARHRLLRKTSDTTWRFRHDKILDWFLRPAQRDS